MALKWNRVQTRSNSLSCGLTAALLVVGFAAAHGATPIDFPDPNLEAVVRAAVNKPTGTLYDTDVTTLTELNGDDSSISNLAGLEHCVNLTRLNLHNNDISDLSPVAGLTSLTMLTVGQNQITDISPVVGLTQMGWLEIHNNDIGNIDAVAGMTEMTYFAASNNQVTDISPVAALTKLQYLGVGDNQVVETSPVVGLVELRALYLEGNEITDVGPCSGLTKLTSLFLARNRISDIAPLVANAGLDTGDTVNLRDNPLDYTALTNHIPVLEGRGVDVGRNAIGLASITPDSGPNDGTVQITDLQGAYFNTGIVVELWKTGLLSIAASSIDVTSSESLSCAFDLTGREMGAWDVYVRNPNDDYGFIRGGFTVTGPASAKHWQLY